MKLSSLKLKTFYFLIAGTLILAGFLMITGSKINVEKFISWFKQSAYAQSSCHLLTSSSSANVPNGFGAWWDVFTGKLSIKADCSETSATINVGDGDNHYIYEKGYHWKGDHWETVNFSGPDKVSGHPWYRNSASATINLSSSDLSNKNYVVAYVCTWRTNQWKCGCSDSTCAQGKWQIQTFKKTTDTTDNPPTISITNPNNNQTVSGTITISANASDDLGVKEVEFWVGDTEAGVDNAAPYQVSFDTNQAANGNQEIEAIAIDASDNETSDFINVNVENAETITLSDYWPMKAGNYWKFNDGASYTIEAKDTTRYPGENTFRAPWKNPDGSGEMTHVFNDSRGIGDYGAYYFDSSGNPTNGSGFDYSPPKKGAE